jgi:uncharacterized protein DUF5907
MAFTLANWGCQQPSMNAGQETIIPYGGSSTVENTCNVFTYVSPNDVVATIIAANYFLTMWPDLSVNDIIWGSGTDASFAVQVTAVSSTSVTVASMGITTSIGTANIVNGAVTYAKIQNASAGDVLLGNPTGSAHAYEEVTLGNGLSFAGTTLQVNPSLASQAIVPMTLAQFLGMYATPFELLAAPGSGLMNVVDSVYINLVYGSAALANGGAVSVQYGNTDHAGGTLITNAEAAADYIAASANTMFKLSGTLGTGVATSAGINTAVYISNASGAFTAGTGDTFNVIVNYRTVAAT